MITGRGVAWLQNPDTFKAWHRMNQTAGNTLSGGHKQRSGLQKSVVVIVHRHVHKSGLNMAKPIFHQIRILPNEPSHWEVLELTHWPRLLAFIRDCWPLEPFHIISHNETFFVPGLTESNQPINQVINHWLLAIMNHWSTIDINQKLTQLLNIASSNNPYSVSRRKQTESSQLRCGSCEWTNEGLRLKAVRD